MATLLRANSRLGSSDGKDVKSPKAVASSPSTSSSASNRPGSQQSSTAGSNFSSPKQKPVGASPASRLSSPSNQKKPASRGGKLAVGSPSSKPWPSQGLSPTSPTHRASPGTRNGSSAGSEPSALDIAAQSPSIQSEAAPEEPPKPPPLVVSARPEPPSLEELIKPKPQPENGAFIHLFIRTEVESQSFELDITSSASLNTLKREVHRRIPSYRPSHQRVYFYEYSNQPLPADKSLASIGLQSGSSVWIIMDRIASGTLLRSIGGLGKSAHFLPGQPQFNRPFGILLDRQRQRFLVSDWANHRVLALNSSDWSLTWMFGATGRRGLNQHLLYGPRHMALSPDSKWLFVCDSNDHRITILLAEDGQLVDTFGEMGSGRGEFMTPVGICTTERHVWICDQDNHRVLGVPVDWSACDEHSGGPLPYFCRIEDYLHLGLTAKPGSDQYSFQRPSAIAAVGSDQLWICDSGNHRLQIVSSVDGVLLQSIGNEQVISPQSLCFDSDSDLVFVSESGGKRVSVFHCQSLARVAVLGEMMPSASASAASPSTISSTSTRSTTAVLSPTRMMSPISPLSPAASSSSASPSNFKPSSPSTHLSSIQSSSYSSSVLARNSPFRAAASISLNSSASFSSSLMDSSLYSSSSSVFSCNSTSLSSHKSSSSFSAISVPSLSSFSSFSSSSSSNRPPAILASDVNFMLDNHQHVSFGDPAGICIHADAGEVLITDFLHSRILIFRKW